MGRVVHFEIGASDPARAIRFYETVFGWEIKKWDGPLEYWLVMTGDEKKPGINGAIMKRTSIPELFPTSHLKKMEEHSLTPKLPKGYGSILTIDVEQAEETLEKIKAAGGKQLDPLEFIPGVGRFCYCEDTEGNQFGIMQEMLTS